jgi:hypothetical protein
MASEGWAVLLSTVVLNMRMNSASVTAGCLLSGVEQTLYYLCQKRPIEEQMRPIMEQKRRMAVDVLRALICVFW